LFCHSCFSRNRHSHNSSIAPRSARAARYSATHHGTSFLVIQSGKTLSKNIRPEGAQNAAENLQRNQSVLEFGGAYCDGRRVAQLDARVADTIPEWQSDPRKSRVTFDSCSIFPVDWRRDFFCMVVIPVIAIPSQSGNHCGRARNCIHLWPSALQVFHRLLKTKLRGEAPRRYLERRVLRRLGLGPQRYLQDRAGNPLLAAAGSLPLANGQSWANWSWRTARPWCRLARLPSAGVGRCQPRVLAGVVE